MPYKYQISKGHEHRVFAGQGVKNLGDGTLQSDHELDSPYLTLIKDGEQMTVDKPEAPTAGPDQKLPPQPVAPAAPPAPAPTKPEEGAK